MILNKITALFQKLIIHLTRVNSSKKKKFYLKIFAKQTRYDSFVKLFSFTIKNVDDVCFRI